MPKVWKNLTSYFLILSLLFILCSGCAVTKPEVIYQGVPEGYVSIKKETLNKILSELVWQKQQLIECLERERK